MMNMMSRNINFNERLKLLGTLMLLVFTGVVCGRSHGFLYTIEGTLPGDGTKTVGPDPFNPPDPTPIPGSTTCGTGGNCSDSFTQTPTSIGGLVDVVWMIDDSGSMGDEQTAIKDNAALFTVQLSSNSLDYKIMIITSSVENDAKLKFPRTNVPIRVDGKDATYNCPTMISLANNNPAEFARCAIVGAGGALTGHEEGLEAVRRALDKNYPKGPWAPTSTVAAPLNSGFLRTAADLHIIYVSDEQDEPDQKTVANGNSWAGKTGVTDAMIDGALGLRSEIGGPLIDDGHLFDIRYAFFPLVANHVAFLKSLKADSSKVHAHAIVRPDIASCTQASEVGSRYVAVADAMDGSTTPLCGDWANTMDQIGKQAAGLKKCFKLEDIPTDRTSIAATVTPPNTTASNAFKYSPFGNQVCFTSVPAAGAAISVTYK